jgi:D-glycero-alpha-D-manno-heptose-7-phosphate kinase
MLIARAPLRISLAGGGTDLEAYYGKYGGAVVSTSIDKYFYVFMSLSDSEHIQVSSSDYQTFYRQSIDEAPLWDGDLRLPKAIINRFGIHTGLSVFLASQVPPGTGLGSSSTVAVALIKAMSVLCGRRLTRGQIAELACEIEIDQLKMPIGRQDQYAAAFGGMNFLEFRSDGVAVQPFDLPANVQTDLERRLMLFFTGRSRNSAEILTEQKRNSERNRAGVIEALHVIHESAVKLRRDLQRGDIGAVGECLHRSWMAKRQLAHGISDPWIDHWYEAARSAGASGGKIAGAGGGGFLLLYCEPEQQDQVTAALKATGLNRMDFRFESGGAMVIVNTLAAQSEAVGVGVRTPSHA